MIWSRRNMDMMLKQILIQPPFVHQRRGRKIPRDNIPIGEIGNINTLLLFKAPINSKLVRFMKNCWKFVQNCTLEAGGMIPKAPGMISTPAATQGRLAGSFVQRKFSSDFLKLRKRSSPGRSKVGQTWTSTGLRHKKKSSSGTRGTLWSSVS